MENILKIFLASSSELSEERIQFELFISRENDKLIKKGIYIQLIIWEKFNGAISQTRLQDEYNKAVKECDIFVMLFYSKVGQFTHEEFTTALETFNETGKPTIYTYFKEAKINTKNISDEIISMVNFKKYLKKIGHFHTSYESSKGLLLDFSNQLERILNDKFIKEKSNNSRKVTNENKELEKDVEIIISGWKHLKKEDFNSKSKKNLELFYKGSTPTWDILQHGTFERDMYKNIISYFDEGNAVALIKGAGGEGKSTLMMQVALYYFEKRYNVFLINNNLINFETLRKRIKGDTLLLIDEANQIHDLYNLINPLRIYSHIKIIMTSRSNEWNYFLSNNSNSGLIKRIIGKSGEFTLKALSNREIENLTKLLLKNKIITEDKGKEWKQDLKQESKRFLLAAMLKATNGKRLEFILEDILEKISEWEDGFLALKVLGFIVNLEVKKVRDGSNLYCTNKLLQTYLKDVEQISDKKYFKIKQYLFQEAFIQDNQNKQTTRNTIISELFYKFLFRNDSLSLLSEFDINYDILRTSVLIDSYYSRNIIDAIPLNYDIQKDAELLSEIYKSLYEFGALKRDYFRWSKVEHNLNNFGDFDKKYSTKWIYKTAIDRKIKDYTLYLKFAEVEEKQNNIGDYESEYSTKWLLKEVTQNSKEHTAYLRLAEIEEKQHNTGDYNKEYSAKWWLLKATQNSKEHTAYLRLAEIEEKQHNTGDYNKEYSAKWWLLKATQNSKEHAAYVRLAEIEEKQHNTGDYNKEYSAKWWLLKATQNSKEHAAYVRLAEIEEKQHNTGDYNKEYSAKWWLLKATQNSKEHTAYLRLAEIEEKQHNTGDYNKEYSAKWWLLKAAQNSKEHTAYLRLAEIEEKQHNTGDYNKEYSAKWWLLKAAQNSKEHAAYVRLAEIEEKQHNTGDYNKEYSAKWWLLKAAQNSKDYSAFSRLARIENAQNNIGDYNKVNSAKWWLFRATKELNGFSLSTHLKLALLEEELDNLGSFELKHSAKWWLKKIIDNVTPSVAYNRLVELEEEEEEEGKIRDENIEHSIKWFLKNYHK
jgi:hypothetical protein